MKAGMLIHEYEVMLKSRIYSEKLSRKGNVAFSFMKEVSLFFREKNDGFVLYFNFLKSHEFDEDEYVLKLTNENGSIVTISKLGTAFYRSGRNTRNFTGKMYEKVVNHLKEALPDFDATTLLKLAFLMREGNASKSVPQENP